MLLKAALGKDVMGVAEFGEPQPGRLCRIRVVRNIADNMENAFGHLLIPIGRIRLITLNFTLWSSREID